MKKKTVQQRVVLTVEERRLRRKERREKQRERNIVRAEMMHTARMEENLRTACNNNEPDASNQGSSGSQQVHIGCSGWFYWHWRGRFYPADLPTSEWFAYYRKTFATVELNAPFYSWPTLATVKRWTRQAGEGRFLYTVKVCELITHVKRFARTKTLISDFGIIADLLGPRMGCFLFQLPPSLHYTSVRLKQILGQLDPACRNVLEFRHKSWWNERVFSALRETGTIFCSCSAPQLPDELIETADDIYMRFHGKARWYRHNYTQDELSIWSKRIKKSAAKTVWVYFNNDYEGSAPDNARELSRLLQISSSGKRIRSVRSQMPR